MRTLHLEPYGGLCNRMGAIDAAMTLATELNMRLAIYWYLDQGLGCRFETLFVAPPNVRLVQADIRSLPGKCIEKAIKRLIKWAGGYTPTVIKLENVEEEKEKIRSARITRIKSCSAFYGDGRFVHLFKPVPELQAVIDLYKKRLGSEAVGIHIRRTDHVDAIKFSPLEAFERIIEQEFLASPQCVFFLATDDPQVEKAMVEKFPSTTFVTLKDKPFERFSIPGMKASLIDLYCLASCCRIYGSAESTYGPMAAQIFGIPFKKVVLQD